MSISIDTASPRAYEDLSVLIQAYEEAAARSNQREGILVLLHNPLTAVESALDTNQEVLTRTQTTRSNVKNVNDKKQSILDLLKNGGSSASGQVIHNNGISVSTDTDLADLFGGPDNPAENYLEDCLNCNLRVRFDWQLKPLNLLGPMQDFLNNIESALDSLLDRIDPLQILKDLCDLLNSLNQLFCPQDLLLILMALKMMLKKYLLQMFKIKLDWTVLLGPLLKLIIEGITDLLESLLAILLAPIDCALDALATVNQVYKEARDLVSSIKNIVNDPSALLPATSLKMDYADLSWLPGISSSSQDLSPVTTGTLQRENVSGSKAAGADGSFPLPSGFSLEGKNTIIDALSDPNFDKATIFDKLIIPLTEAKNWLIELEDTLVSSLHSLSVLVGGGLSLNISNIGVLLFLMDMISVILMIIKMLKLNPDVLDWCTELQARPNLLEEQLRTRYNALSVDPVDTDAGPILQLRSGPDIVGVINTCATARTSADQQTITQWISDLQARGANL